MNPEPFEPADDDEAIARQLRELAPGALSAAAPDAELRHALLRRSSAVVRRRPLLRRLGAAVVLLLVYGAGIATARSVWVGPVDRSGELGSPVRAPEIAASLPPAGEPRIEDADPLEIERRALASPRERRVELLKLAGDRYLGERQEMDAALRCYRGALSLMRPEEQASISHDETWLFTALKSSRT